MRGERNHRRPTKKRDGDMPDLPGGDRDSPGYQSGLDLGWWAFADLVFPSRQSLASLIVVGRAGPRAGSCERIRRCRRC